MAASLVVKLKFLTNHAGYTRTDKNRARIHKRYKINERTVII